MVIYFFFNNFLKAYVAASLSYLESVSIELAAEVSTLSKANFSFSTHSYKLISTELLLY